MKPWLDEELWAEAAVPRDGVAVLEVAVCDEDLGVIVTCRTADGQEFTGADRGPGRTT